MVILMLNIYLVNCIIFCIALPFFFCNFTDAKIEMEIECYTDEKQGLRPGFDRNI